MSNVNRWEAGKRYRGRAVGPSEVAIRVNEKTGTEYVEALLEVELGPMLGERLRWRGYLNSPKNAEVTMGELRAMGWRANKLGDWSGIGSAEIQFSCQIDAGDGGKSYVRAAFVRPPLALKEQATDPHVVDDLNRRFGHLIGSAAAPSSNGVGPAGPTAADEWDEQMAADMQGEIPI